MAKKSWMNKVKLEKEYVQVPNETAQAVEAKSENPIPLISLGLLVSLWSHDVERWELHKTELQKRFYFDKRNAVDTAFDGLLVANYMLHFECRNEKGQFEHQYYYSIEVIPEDKIELIKNELKKEYKEIFFKNDEVRNKKALKEAKKANVENPQRDENDPNVEIQQWESNSGKATVETPHLYKELIKKDLNIKDLNTKLTNLVSSENVLFFDSIQKENFPDIPYDQLKDELIKDAEKGKVTMNTANQYTALMNGRIKFYLEKAQTKELTGRELSNNLKAILLKSMDEDEKKELYSPQPEPTPEELSEKQKEIERLMAELKKDK